MGAAKFFKDNLRGQDGNFEEFDLVKFDEM